MTSELLEQIEALEARNESVRDESESILKGRERDKSIIAKIIVWSFVVTVGMTFILVFIFVIFDYLYLTEFSSTCTDALKCDYLKRLDKPIEKLTNLISSVMLPVVTLVLGYYFGKEQAEEKNP